MPKISIIMPVYNGARFLAQAIDSVLAQSFQDWELIIIDDGSTDSSPEILAEYDDPRISVFRQANGGEARARNAGLKRVSGEYVAFLDSDDQYLPDALQDYVNFLDGHPRFDALYSDGYLCDSENRRLSSLTEHRAGIYNGKILEQIILTPTIITVPVCTALRYESIRAHEVYFDPEVGYGTDWDFWTQLAVHAQFGYLDKKTCVYRIHESNMTSTATIEKRKSDQVNGRLKVLNAGWFDSLSSFTQERFFYLLVIELLTGDPDKQIEILSSSKAKVLSNQFQAQLYGLIGVETLLQEKDTQLSRRFLRLALKVYPKDLKAQGLLFLTQFPLPFVLLLIRLWRFVNREIAKRRARGEHIPKPLPEHYGPIVTSST